MTTVIRRATKADAKVLFSFNAGLLALHAGALPWLFNTSRAEPLPPAGVTAVFANPNNLIFIAEVDSLPAGCVQAQIIRQPATPWQQALEMVHVDAIAVLPKYQMRGIGRALL